MGHIGEDAAGGHRLSIYTAQVGGPFHVHLLALFAHEHRADPFDCFSGHDTRMALFVGRQLVGMHHILQSQGYDLPFGIAQGSLPRVVHILEATIWIHALDQVRGVLEQIAVALFAGLQGLPVLFHTRDIPRHAHCTEELPILIEKARSR